MLTAVGELAYMDTTVPAMIASNRKIPIKKMALRYFVPNTDMRKIFPDLKQLKLSFLVHKSQLTRY